MEDRLQQHTAATQSGTPASGRRMARIDWMWLGGLLAVAALVRIVGLAHLSVSMDEVSELRIAHAGFGDIVSIDDGFPPLYHLILHVLVPTGDFSARVLSSVLGLATVAVVWIWVHRQSGSRPARWATALVALSPLAVNLSQEGRAYGLFMFLAALSIWALWRALDEPSPGRWIAWGAICAAGTYTHYMFAVTVAAEIVVVLVERRRLPLREMWPGIVALAVLTAPILAFLGEDLAVQAAGDRVTAFNPMRIMYVGYGLIAGLSLGPSVRDLHTLGALETLQAAWVWIVLLLPVAVLLALRGYSALAAGTRRRLMVLTIAGAVLVFAAVEVAGVGLRLRYFAWLVVPIALWFAAGLTSLTGIRRWLVVGALVVAASFSLVAHQIDPAHQTEDARGVAAHLESTGALDEPVLVSGWYMVRPITYYLDAPAALALPDEWDPEKGRLGHRADDPLPLVGIPLLSPTDFPVEDALRWVDDATAPGAGYTFIYARPFDGDPSGELLAALTARDGLVLEKSFAGVDVYRGHRRG